MNRTKLLQNPLPVDRMAQRVVKAARKEDLWDVPVHPDAFKKFSREMLPVAPIPPVSWRNPQFRDPTGLRRGRLVVLGYAAEQGGKKKGARWVVRCDCGNYEHRNMIFRWAGTQAPDMCIECRTRSYKKNGNKSPWSPEPAVRATVAAKEASDARRD